MDFSFLTGCASQFWHITSGVCRAVTACLGGLGRPAILSPDFVMACYERVNRGRVRLLALMERVRTGRVKVLAGRAAAVVMPAGSARVAAGCGIVLPRRFGWLVHLVGYQAAGHASQLAHLLGDPEMVALVRDVPQARRILAPLCRMLGVKCAGLRAVPRIRVAKAGLTDVAHSRRRMSEPLAPERAGYVPSARWPKGVISPGVVWRGVRRSKPA